MSPSLPLLSFWLPVAAALGCALIGGVFFAFSTFVMRALRRLPAAQGIAAMQSINVVVVNPLFLGAFLGTALLCGVLLVEALRHGATATAVASLGYLVGTFGVTMAGNVPLNHRLARLSPPAPASAEVWSDYLRVWSRWNHVRTVAALAAAALLMVDLAG